MRLPDRPAVKILERLRARRHVQKTSQPDKSVWIIQVPKLTDDLHPERFLRFDKFPVNDRSTHPAAPDSACIAAAQRLGSKFALAAGTAFPRDSCDLDGLCSFVAVVALGFNGFGNKSNNESSSLARSWRQTYVLH